MTPRPRSALAGALLAALALAGPADAAVKPGQQTITSGAVTATFTWKGGQYGVHDAHLTIARSGTTVFDAAVPNVQPDEGLVLDDPLEVRDLDADGEPEVLARGYTGGAHCCTVLGIYGWNGTTYTGLVRNYGSGGYTLIDRDKDGRPEIETLDARFEYLFASYAASFRPPLILSYDHGRFTNVTRRFPDVIRRDAKETLGSLKDFESHRYGNEARGPMAAYVADQYLLGRGSVGLRELDRRARTGLLGTRKGARAYRKRLLRVLHNFGYR